jgi:hypothetical protein
VSSSSLSSSSSSSSSSFPEHLLRLLKQLAVTSHDLRILACCVWSVKKNKNHVKLNQLILVENLTCFISKKI